MLINKTDTFQVVKIVMPDGKKDSINLQPKSRAVPPPGAKIDPQYIASYRKTILGVDNYAPSTEE